MDLQTPHIPVLPTEVVQYLITDPHGIYLDGTVGFGGHAELIVPLLKPPAKYIGIDVDPVAVDFTQNLFKNLHQTVPVEIRQWDYGNFPAMLHKLNIDRIQGMLLDIGVSSMDIDNSARGFSYAVEGPLDMRFDQGQTLTARELLCSSTAAELGQIIRQYGEERFHKKIARSIVAQVRRDKMNTTIDLRNAVAAAVGSPTLTKSLARVFQAIRIAVNDELNRLERTLKIIPEYLNPGGRLAVISFHSLEDRIVKHFFKEEARTCICPPELPICICNVQPSLKIITKRSVRPGEAEIHDNPRARSSKLRIAERI